VTAVLASIAAALLKTGEALAQVGFSGQAALEARSCEQDRDSFSLQEPAGDLHSRDARCVQPTNRPGIG